MISYATDTSGGNVLHPGAQQTVEQERVLLLPGPKYTIAQVPAPF